MKTSEWQVIIDNLPTFIIPSFQGIVTSLHAIETAKRICGNDDIHGTVMDSDCNVTVF